MQSDGDSVVERPCSQETVQSTNLIMALLPIWSGPAPICFCFDLVMRNIFRCRLLGLTRDTTETFLFPELSVRRPAFFRSVEGVQYPALLAEFHPARPKSRL